MTAASHIRHIASDVVTRTAASDPGVHIIASDPEGKPSPHPYRTLNDTIHSPTPEGGAMSALSNRHITEPEAGDFVMTARVGYRGDALWTEPNFMTLALCAFFWNDWQPSHGAQSPWTNVSWVAGVHTTR